MRRTTLINANWLWLALWLVACASPLLRAAPLAGSDAKGVEFFESQIRPLLADKCYQCHSRQSKKVKGGLLLDSPEALLKGGDSGPIVVPGDLDNSLLIKAVRYKDEDLRMPPDGKRLTEAQVAELETWVKMGSPMPQVDVVEDKIKARAREHAEMMEMTVEGVTGIVEGMNPKLLRLKLEAFVHGPPPKGKR